MIPVPPLVFLDANVLFSRSLRDWIALLALRSDCTAYDLRWSEDVLAEWVYRLRRANPGHSDHAIGGRRRDLGESFPDAVIVGYDPGSVVVPCDPDDRHVVAAVLHGQVDMLVTGDRRARFAEIAQDRFDVLTPDEFLMWVATTHPALVPLVLRQQLAFYNRNVIVTGGRSAEDLVVSLRKAGATSFARHVESLMSI